MREQLTEQQRSEMARQLRDSIEDLTAYANSSPRPKDADDIEWDIKVKIIALASLEAESVYKDRDPLHHQVNAPAIGLDALIPEPFKVFRQAGGVMVAVKSGKTKNHLFGIGYNACIAEIINHIINSGELT